MSHFNETLEPRLPQEGMRRDTLRRELAAALVVKFCLLALIWWFFFAGRKVPVDSDGMAGQLLNAPAHHLVEKIR